MKIICGAMWINIIIDWSHVKLYPIAGHTALLPGYSVLCNVTHAVIIVLFLPLNLQWACMMLRVRDACARGVEHERAQRSVTDSDPRRWPRGAVRRASPKTPTEQCKRAIQLNQPTGRSKRTQNLQRKGIAIHLQHVAAILYVRSPIRCQRWPIVLLQRDFTSPHLRRANIYQNGKMFTEDGGRRRKWQWLLHQRKNMSVKLGAFRHSIDPYMKKSKDIERKEKKCLFNSVDSLISITYSWMFMKGQK